MSRTRYCSTCGTLLSEGAVICGECGARYQASPYERRATDAPGAWSQAPMPRSRDLGREEPTSQEEGVELITRESLASKTPSATTLRHREQYDQEMVMQPPMQQNDPGHAWGAPSGPGSPVVAPGAPSTGYEMEPPLDGCSPSTPVKRLLAALIDSVIATLVLVPQIVGWILLATAEEIGLLPLVLIGVGVALPLAYVLLMIWLVGAKGFTLGKLILGLRVTRASEEGPIGFLRSAGRWVLFGLVPPIMALSIFLDPKKHLRGFHDRVVDSAVVDIKAGRHPMKPRPDDFERAGAEHYLGAPSVAVSTHENLLAEPGAAWQDSSQSAPAQPEATGGGGDPQQQVAPSPYAPQPSGSSAVSAADAPMTSTPWSSPPAPDTAASQQGTDGGWAPPPTDPIPPQPQSGDQPPPWGQP
ncbi:MAG: RDD family protein, partial [Brachybacterium sp.]|nr:RDD family protein [Brachybacterium sp.]